MNINVELGNGITIKVPSEKYYNSTDYEWEKFMQENIIYPQHQWFISDPFDDSVLLEIIPLHKEDIEDLDTWIDFNPNEWG